MRHEGTASGPDLTDRVALVAGATRAAGRGIAVELGAAGAIVYCTGRTTRAHRSPMNRPETIEETAELVSAAGGRGIAVRVDHTDPDGVGELIRRIADEQAGRLDLLVNDVWGGDDLTDWDAPFWKHSLGDGLALLHNGVDSHLVTSWFAAPLMVERGAGLIVEMTDGDTPKPSQPDPGYRGSLFYDLAKASAIRVAQALDAELRPHGVTALAVTPGWLRSERVLEREGVTEANWRDGYEMGTTTRGRQGWLASESPRYVGRAVVALAGDPQIGRRGGEVLTSWDLATEYGFTDLNGTRPHWPDRSVEVLGPDGSLLRRDRYRP
jgi:NAD(P)-dependent dehydrogenase (short-subunit alcohol dehydrogenase family)